MLVSFSQINFMMRENRQGTSNLCWEGWWWKRVERLTVERATSTTQKTPSAASSSRSRRGSSRTCITHTWGRQWSFFYSNRNCCQCLTYYTAQSPPWELFWTTKEWLVRHMSLISPLIESLYFICTLKDAVGSRVCTMCEKDTIGGALLKSWCYYGKRKQVHVIHWVCWS